MTKSETFFVCRAKRGFPLAVVTPNAAASRTWLEISIEEQDPFQGHGARLWLRLKSATWVERLEGAQ